MTRVAAGGVRTWGVRTDGRLAGRRILIVGAGQQRVAETEDIVGNGRAIATLFAHEGAKVALADRLAENLARTVADITALGARPVELVCDATREEAVQAMVAEAVARLGGLDGLVMNLGTGAGAGLAGTTAELWNKVFRINTLSHFLGCRHALPMMSEGGAVVLISSLAGYLPASGMPAYDASKAALEGLCRHVAKEGAERQIRVNLVVPGLIDTPIGRLATEARASRAATQIPLGREGTAWEVAHAALFLMSAESSYITGHALPVDGGLLALR
jgi:NAD(P)-dependent dehydrogenase (short-subunit alcohol dehydrogenase family)